MGNYTLTVKYNSDDNYLPNETSKNITINKANPKLNIDMKNVDYGNEFIINAALTGTNNIKLNGRVYVLYLIEHYME